MTSSSTIENGSNLLLLTPAAKIAGRSRNHFHRLYRKRLVPPPIMSKPLCRWSRRQLELWTQGLIQKNPDTGFWYEWFADTESWKLLANQYISTLPNRAA